MAQPSSAYDPRDPASTIVYGMVRDHIETFRAHAASLRDGEGLPSFVEQEFRDFLRCGCLAGGFARFRCTACGLDRSWLSRARVAGSARGVAAGACPSGRHLIDHVFPDVPVRQWVLACRIGCGTCLRGITSCVVP